MALGEYRPPNQINTDEDKYGYGRITFTKIQILYALVGFGVGFLIFSLLNKTHLALFQILGIVIIIILTLAGIAIGGLTLPNSKYLAGGGLRIDLYIFRKLKKKLMKQKHVVYCRNIDRDKLVSYRGKYNYADSEGSQSLLQDLKSMFGGE